MEIGVRYGARPQLIAELVIRCLKSDVEFNGWHYLLENESCSNYVAAVIDLAEHEALLRPVNVTSRDKMMEQFSSPEQEAIRLLAESLDSAKRSAINVATRTNRQKLERGMLYMERYNTAECTKIHDSEVGTRTDEHTTRVCMRMHICTQTHTRVCLHAHAPLSMCTRSISSFTCSLTRSLARSLTHSLTHSLTRSTHTCTHARMHMHTCPHAPTYTDIPHYSD